MGGSWFSPKAPRDDSAERMQKQLDSERASRLKIDTDNAADAAEKRKQTYGYSQLMGEGATYSGFTGSQDKASKKSKTKTLGGGGTV